MSSFYLLLILIIKVSSMININVKTVTMGMNYDSSGGSCPLIVELGWNSEAGGSWTWLGKIGGCV